MACLIAVIIITSLVLMGPACLLLYKDNLTEYELGLLESAFDKTMKDEEINSDKAMYKTMKGEEISPKDQENLILYGSNNPYVRYADPSAQS